MTYYNDCNNVPGSATTAARAGGERRRPYAPVGHIPPIPRHGSPSASARRARPSMHIFVFQELTLAHNHNASGCTGTSIGVDDLAQEQEEL